MSIRRGARRLAVLAALLVSGAARAEAPTTATAGAQDPRASAHGPHGGLQLPLGMRLNARFDVALERVGYTNDFDGTTALRNYHHFVFLSRHGADDPLYFTAELVDLTFYAIGVRHRLPDAPWTLSAEAGKILVPFGAEPLFHHLYGGLGGFDQAVLPTVFAQLGFAASARHRYDDGNVRLDLYTVQGYELSGPADVLDLRADFSPTTDVRLAIGFRASASYGPATFYYSLLYNPLDFDRHLVLQAFDASLSGVPGVPFLEDLRLSLGVLRADVFGGAPPASYRFADYLELHYSPTPWFFARYRAGLDTVDNRAGVFYDDAREGPGDSSAHTIAVGARWFGATVTLSHTWRLEKGVELDNDFLRLTVAYDL